MPAEYPQQLEGSVGNPARAGFPMHHSARRDAEQLCSPFDAQPLYQSHFPESFPVYRPVWLALVSPPQGLGTSLAGGYIHHLRFRG